MPETKMVTIDRDLSSGDVRRCEQGLDALRALPDDALRAWLEEPLEHARLEDGVVHLSGGHRIFWRRRTRASNALAVLRLAGRLEELTTLELLEMPVVTLYPLAGLTNLRALTVRGDPDVSLDLTPLSGMAALTTLEIQRGQVTDLRPLIGLKQLRTLAIRESASLVDARPLLAMPALERLDLGGCGSLQPRRERAMMADAEEVRRYRAKIARAMKRAQSLRAEERRWLAAAEKAGLLKRGSAPAPLGGRPLKRILGSRDPGVARQGLELLRSLTGEQLSGVAADEALFPWMLAAPSVEVRRCGIRLLLEHVPPVKAHGLAEGISLDGAGAVVLRSGVGRRGYMRGVRADPSAALALLRAAGRLDGVASIMLRREEVLSDASALTGLSSLCSLKLRLPATPEDAAHVMAGLTGLPALTSLTLSGAGLESLRSLQQVPSLQRVHLSRLRRVADLDGLQHLPGLRSLTIDGAARLADLSVLCEAGALEELELQYAPHVSDLSPLSGLPALRSVRLHGCPVRDLQPLSGLRRLESLGLHGLDRVTDIGPLTGLTALRTLVLRCGRLDDLSAIGTLTGLELLSITAAAGRMPALETLTALSSLYLMRCEGLDSLHPLSGLHRLSQLQLDAAPITSLAGIEALAALKTLRVEDCAGLADVSALSSLPALQTLSISGSPSLTVLTALADCPVLDHLSLSGLGVRTPFSAYSREKVERNIAWLLRDPA